MTAVFLFSADDGVLAQDQQRQAAPITTVSRPFPTTQVDLGDVVLAIPTQWVDSKFIDVSLRQQRSVVFHNAHMPDFRSTDQFGVPALALFGLVEVPPELSESNLRSQRAELEKRWSERGPDDHGFWHWKTDEFIFVSDSAQRPLGQPLIVKCRDALPYPDPLYDPCSVRFYWTPRVSVRYDFRKTQFPEAEWTRLDRQVLDFLRFLDASQTIGLAR
jgi:hypothetical protein